MRAYIADHVLSMGLATGELDAEAKCAARDAAKVARAVERDVSNSKVD